MRLGDENWAVSAAKGLFVNKVFPQAQVVELVDTLV